MRPFVCLMIISFFSTSIFAQLKIGNTEVDTATVASRLSVPWEIRWGSDGHIWFTERNGYVSRLNPNTKQSKRVLRISDVHEQSESGLLGLEMHPDFANNPYVYLVYTYLDNTSIKEKLVRYTYQNDTLTAPYVLISGINGNTTHDGSRLLVLPDNTLLMSTGDAQQQSHPLDTTKLAGKFLRFNLDGSIPADNPFKNSYVYSYGHRNPQGLVYARGKIYSSEHGPSNDDEINIIEKKRNYGWPTVQGMCNTSAEQNYCVSNNVREPIKTWSPTIATAGLDYYSYTAIPELSEKLVLLSLKENDVRVLTLSTDGLAITDEKIVFNNAFGRLRDLCFAPNGDMYLATSNKDGRGTPGAVDDRIIKISPRKVVNGVDLTSNAPTLVVYPNPTTGILNITNTYNVPVVIVNGMGEQVMEVPATATTIDMSGLAKGLYFYGTKGSTVFTKLAVE